MNRRTLPILLSITVLALTQLMCGTAWTRDPFTKSNGIKLCNAFQLKLEDGSPLTGICMDNCLSKTDTNSYYARPTCNDNPTQAECNSLNTSGLSGAAPAGYTLVSQSSTSFDCSDNPKETTQTRVLTMVLTPSITMTKSASPTTFSAAGQTITYSYVITNSSQKDLSNIAVTDDKTKVTCPVDTVKAGASITCKATYTTTDQDMSQGSVKNTANFTGSFDANTASAASFTGVPVSATVTEAVEVTCKCDGTTEVCSDGSSTENAAACTQLPAWTGPLLTGEVLTLCDTVNRPVNLRLVSGTDPALVTQELANGNLHIAIAGTDISSTCKINASNKTLLTCTYPSGITNLPAEGQVIYRSTVLQTFRFDGENGCVAPPSGSSNSQPATCDPHTDSSCPLDCSNPANADLCG